jgi:lipopolysaccharide biosynthesis glycosyltransferase
VTGRILEYPVYIGTESSQFVAQRVLQFSIDCHSDGRVKTIPVRQKSERVGGTNFGFVRFQVPSLNRFSGKAVYIDADQVVLEDIRNLFDLVPEQFSIGLVTNPEGTFNGNNIPAGNQTSVMVLNCSDLADWKVPKLFSNVVPNREELQSGQIHYRDFMALKWFDQSRIFSIPPTWNHFNIVRDDTNLVHFSHVRSQPWMNPSHELSDWWNEWLVRAVKEGYVSRSRLRFEIWRGHVNRQFHVR